MRAGCRLECEGWVRGLGVGWSVRAGCRLECEGWMRGLGVGWSARAGGEGRTHMSDSA